ncbi:MAG: hypothetical protein MJ211_10840 [Bacteroidales bacterium]|nr:hypothetical protein [Bacteroidales bacterium]
MTLQDISSICAVLLFCSYIFATIYKFGIPKSISDTYYLWRGEKNDVNPGKGLFFTIMMVGCGFLMIFPWLSHSPENIQFLPFISCGGMIFVGCACAFKQTLTNTVHFTSAGIWASSALVWLIMTSSWRIIGVGILLAIIGYLADHRNHLTFWLEIAVASMQIVMFIFWLLKF